MKKSRWLFSFLFIFMSALLLNNTVSFAADKKSTDDGIPANTSTTTSSFTAAPAHLIAISELYTVTLSWGYVMNAEKYIIKRSPVPGGPYTPIYTSTEGEIISFVDIEVVPNTTYYYVVSAVVAGVESSNSNEASAKPTGETTAPAQLIAISEVHTVKLSWGYVTNAEKYIIKRSPVPGGPYTTLHSTTDGETISFVDIEVVPNTTYYYVVSAIVSGIESSNSNEASATPSPGDDFHFNWSMAAAVFSAITLCFTIVDFARTKKKE